jgi:hypothetical protein
MQLNEEKVFMGVFDEKINRRGVLGAAIRTANYHTNRPLQSASQMLPERNLTAEYGVR